MIEANRIWSGRALAFWKEAWAYWTYIGRSGFFGLLFLLLIVGIYAYQKSLQDLPATYPYPWVTTPVLLLVFAISPIRTFVKDADLNFLLPAETQLNKYFRNARIYSLAFQAVVVLMVFSALWPLYVHCTGVQSGSFIELLGLALITKWMNLRGNWFENRLPYSRHRSILKTLRWLASAAAAYAMLDRNPETIALLLLLLFCAGSLVFSRLNKQYLNWIHLIRLEHKHTAAHYLFFSWFAEVPRESIKYKPHRLMAQMTRFLSFKQQNTYAYLYTKTFLRGEIGGIVLRITVLGALLMAAIPNNGAKMLIYGIVLLMTGMQISALEQQHRYILWMQLYPLQEAWRITALTRMMLVPMIAQCLLLGIVFTFTGSPLLAIISFVLSSIIVCLASLLAYPRKLRRSLPQAQ